MANKLRENRLNGFFPLSYLGVIPVSPGNFVRNDRPPTINDSKNFYIGDFWLDDNTHNPPTVEDLWVLVALAGNDATWVSFGSAGANQFVTDAGTAIPVAGVLNVLGAHGINTAGAGNTVTIAINNAITLGDLVALPQGTDALTIVSGDLEFTGNNLVAATNQMIKFAHANRISFFKNSIFMGSGSGNTTCTGLFNYAFGATTMPVITSGERNAAFGNGALSDITTGAANCAFGYVCGSSITTSNRNTLYGDSAGEDLDGNDNCAFGNACLINVTSGTANVAIGNLAGSSSSTVGVTTGARNFFAGNNAASAYTGAESNNIIIGDTVTGVVGESNTIRIGNSGNGASQQNKVYIASAYSNYGTNNTFVGEVAGNLTLTIVSATENTCIGSHAGFSLTTGDSNTLLGFDAGLRVTSGAQNVLVGNNAGAASGASGITTGSMNTAVGDDSLWSVDTGSRNTAIGSQAGSNLSAADSDNICINNLGNLAGSNNTLRIGASTGAGNYQLNKAFIHGIRGITTGVADAVAVLIDSAGQLGTVSSSIRYKENIQSIGHESSAVMALQPKTFNYKSDQTKSMTYGLIAEDVAKVMPKLVVFDEEGQPETVKYLDLIPLMLNEIKKLQHRIEILEKR